MKLRYIAILLGLLLFSITSCKKDDTSATPSTEASLLGTFTKITAAEPTIAPSLIAAKSGSSYTITYNGFTFIAYLDEEKKALITPEHNGCQYAKLTFSVQSPTEYLLHVGDFSSACTINFREALFKKE